MLLFFGPKEVQISNLSLRQAEILTALFRMDDIPYSLAGGETYARISVPIEYRDRLTVVHFEWKTVTEDFRGGFI